MDKNPVLFPRISPLTKILFILSVISLTFIYCLEDYVAQRQNSYTGFVYTPTAIYYINKGKPWKLA
jgi:hypothetical protein